MTDSIRDSWFIKNPAIHLIVMIAMCAVSGCATRPDGTRVTVVDDAQVLMMSDAGLGPREAKQLERVQRYAEMRITGSTGGAIIGGLAGAFVLSDNPLVGAGAGMVAGAALGYLAGAYIANRNSLAEDRRNDLDARLMAARQAVDETEDALADNRAMVAVERRRIARLNREYRAQEITLVQYEDEIEHLEKRLTIVDESLRAAENDVKALEYEIGNAEQRQESTSGFKKQRARMQKAVDSLREERDALIAAISTIPPEVDAPSI